MNCYREGYLEKPKTKKTDANTLLDVEAGTNGYQGGDAGHGCTTYFRIEGHGGACIEVDHNRNGFEVALGGDWELSAIIEALEFIVDTLKEQSREEEKTPLELIHESRIELLKILDYEMKEISDKHYLEGQHLNDYLKVLDRYIEISKLIENKETHNADSQS